MLFVYLGSLLLRAVPVHLFVVGYNLNLSVYYCVLGCFPYRCRMTSLEHRFVLLWLLHYLGLTLCRKIVHWLLFSVLFRFSWVSVLHRFLVPLPPNLRVFRSLPLWIHSETVDRLCLVSRAYVGWFWSRVRFWTVHRFFSVSFGAPLR